MAKRNKKVWTNKLYVMVDNLHKVIRKGHKEDKSQCQAMINYYIKNGFLTQEMKKVAKEIIDKNWSLVEPKPLQGSHYLYAMSDGEFVKVGMSKNYEDRLKRIQTGHPKKLKIVWSCYAAEDSREATRQERKLHKALKLFHTRGEWFSVDCLPLVKNWQVRNREAKSQKDGELINEELDREFRLIIS